MRQTLVAPQYPVEKSVGRIWHFKVAFQRAQSKPPAEPVAWV